MKITMSDPYRVLGVTPSSTDDEIREAYRNLAAKYHPDVQGQGPLSDIAETKMQELNEAYDRIMDIRRGGGKPSSEYTQQSHSGSSLFAEIRRQIQLGNLSIADDMLEAQSNGKPDTMIYEMNDALESMIFRWNFCQTNYAPFFEIDDCRSEIRKLIRNGYEFFTQYEGGLSHYEDT